jgi:hypothetical protein
MKGWKYLWMQRSDPTLYNLRVGPLFVEGDWRGFQILLRGRRFYAHAEAGYGGGVSARFDAGSLR